MAGAMALPTTPPETIDRLLDLYRSGTSVDQILLFLNISRPTAYKYLRSAGCLDRYDPRPRHAVWHEAFDDLTDEAAYWVGLLITDGSIVGKGRRVKLSLQGGDANALERFRTFVRTSAPIETAKTGSKTVRFCSERMCSRLADLGVVPRKTFTARAPDSLIHNRHFWRGVIDGDGGVYPNKNTCPGIRLYGYSTAPLVRQFCNACNERGFPALVRVRPESPTVADVIVNGAPAVAAAKWLYDGCTPESPALERKLEAYQEMITIHGSRAISRSGRYAKRFGMTRD